jgi:hypothetical protein
VKRKLLIGGALALVVILVIMFGSGNEPPPVRVAYAGVSPTQAGMVSFTISNALTNVLHCRIEERRQTNGGWLTVKTPRMAAYGILAHQTTTHSHLASDDTNVWQLAFHYFHFRHETWAMRTRFKLTNFADQQRWPRLAEWLSPVKLQTIYGPRMIGNKPVEEK